MVYILLYLYTFCENSGISPNLCEKVLTVNGLEYSGYGFGKYLLNILK